MAVDTTSSQLTLAEIFVINITTGAIARFTSHDQNIEYGGNTYQAIPIARTPIKYNSDLTVDKVDVSFGLIGLKVGTKQYSIPQIIQRNYLRNAHVRIYAVDYVKLDSHKVLFDGYCTGDVGYNRGIATMSVGSLLDRLKDKVPKLVYEEQCNWQLYSTACGLSASSYDENSSVDTSSSALTIYSSVFDATNHAAGYFNKGKIIMTSGENDNEERSIYKHGDGYVRLTLPYHEDIAVGDTFTAWPGCSKSGEECDTKFSNYANFIGFEFIPKPEMLYG